MSRDGRRLPSYMQPIAGHTASSPAETATKDVLALNIGMFELYGDASKIFQSNILSQHPVILGLFSGDGGKFILYRPGQAPLDAPPVPVVYQLLKSIGHSTMALAEVVGPYLNNPDDHAWRGSMLAYRSRMKSALDGLDALALVTSGNSYTMDQATQDAAAKNPRWVPAISTATFASNGAHVGTQAAAEAARVIFRFGLWPAALDLWGIAPTHATARQWQAARWKDGNLLMPGLAPLALPAIAAKAHARHDVTGAMAHAFSRWGWSRAGFPIAGQTWSADIDALAVRKGSGKYACLDRSSVKFPPTANNRSGPVYTAACASLVRVEIERATGLLRIAKGYSVFECGNALVPEIVVGQAQGGFAMGVGYALLEKLPLYEDGPGNGKWNLGRYVVARATDLPLNGIEIEVLPPLEPTEPPKGIAEIVMIPIVPAIVNAIYDATGHRFQSLPVTQAMIKGVLS